LLIVFNFFINRDVLHTGQAICQRNFYKNQATIFQERTHETEKISGRNKKT
jgi:hypothetical protein